MVRSELVAQALTAADVMVALDVVQDSTDRAMQAWALAVLCHVSV